MSRPIRGSPDFVQLSWLAIDTIKNEEQIFDSRRMVLFKELEAGGKLSQGCWFDFLNQLRFNRHVEKVWWAEYPKLVDPTYLPVATMQDLECYVELMLSRKCEEMEFVIMGKRPGKYHVSTAENFVFESIKDSGASGRIEGLDPFAVSGLDASQNITVRGIRNTKRQVMFMCLNTMLERRRPRVRAWLSCNVRSLWGPGHSTVKCLANKSLGRSFKALTQRHRKMSRLEMVNAS